MREPVTTTSSSEPSLSASYARTPFKLGNTSNSNPSGKTRALFVIPFLMTFAPQTVQQATAASSPADTKPCCNPVGKFVSLISPF
jgi:hypothetical protein